MVGLIQKILFDMVKATAGEEKLLEIKRAAGLPDDKVYLINEVYSDEEWQRLLATALSALNLTPEQAYEIYADFFAKDALKRFPTWFQMSKDSLQFLSIQPTIHNCFATSVLDPKSRAAINDKFRVEKFDDKIITHYKSANQHCDLYKALAKWIINHYQDEAKIEEKKCMKLGGEECEIHIQWTKLGEKKNGNQQHPNI